MPHPGGANRRGRRGRRPCWPAPDASAAAFLRSQGQYPAARAPRWALWWLDAVGLPVQAVVGAAKAPALGLPSPVGVVMGLRTATFGGVARNGLAGVPCVLLTRYSTGRFISALRSPARWPASWWSLWVPLASGRPTWGLRWVLACAPAPSWQAGTCHRFRRRGATMAGAGDRVCLCRRCL
ncbi:MAG: hypothetical protein EXR83_06160 [Gammaproteobacteria bacterium]|nr:hypothetical protein [Gammaproteobacteria bacterium]